MFVRPVRSFIQSGSWSSPSVARTRQNILFCQDPPHSPPPIPPTAPIPPSRPLCVDPCTYLTLLFRPCPDEGDMCQLCRLVTDHSDPSTPLTQPPAPTQSDPARTGPPLPSPLTGGGNLTRETLQQNSFHLGCWAHFLWKRRGGLVAWVDLSDQHSEGDCLFNAAKPQIAAYFIISHKWKLVITSLSLHKVFETIPTR